METFATALRYAIPFFVVLILIEAYVAHRRGLEINRSFDVISSLSSGMSNILKEVLGLSIVIVSYDWMLNNFALFSIESSVLLYVLCFIGIDFAGYWSHRLNHRYNILWNRHIVHHSSEDFNLSCALRQEISAFFSIYFFLYLPLAVIGIPTQIIALVAPIQLFAQFWYHTRLIDRMGFLEHIIVTPSHHRVHHAINDIYIDKNFAQIFIFWDKLFGSFQEELDTVPPVYGIVKPAKTWNPFIINFMHVALLIKDAWRASNFIDKIKIWFMPTGWRPKDVAKKYPIAITTDPYQRSNYETGASTSLTYWSWMQLLFSLAFLYFILFNIANLSMAVLFVFSFFILLSMFAYTSLMDRSTWTLGSEALKFIVGIVILCLPLLGIELDFFRLEVKILFTIYLGLSLFLSAYFMKHEKLDSLPTPSFS